MPDFNSIIQASNANMAPPARIIPSPNIKLLQPAAPKSIPKLPNAVCVKFIRADADPVSLSC